MNRSWMNKTNRSSREKKERNHVIAEMLDKGATRKFVAEIYGISPDRVSQIWWREKNRKRWSLWNYNLKENIWMDSFSVRLRNCLRRAEIETEEQLYEKIEKGGFCIRQFGEGCVEELNSYLHRKIALGEYIERDRISGRWGKEDIVYKSREIVFAEQ